MNSSALENPAFGAYRKLTAIKGSRHWLMRHNQMIQEYTLSMTVSLAY